MTYSGSERRKYPRVDGRFIVAYRIFNDSEDLVDLTQSKNISQGGILLTTNRFFQKDTKLVLEIRLPFDPYPIMLIGRVIDSKEVTKNLIYDTRLEFIAVDEIHRKVIRQVVDYYLKRSR